MTAAPVSSPYLVLAAIMHDLLWLLFPDNVGLLIAAFFLTAGLILVIVIECVDAGEPHLYIPKRRRPPKSLWIKLMLKTMSWCTATLVKVTNNIKI